MNNIQNLGPLEQEIMSYIWQHQTVTVREVWSDYKKNHATAYTTIMTIMNRLVEKNVLIKEKQGKAYIYRAKATKDQALRGVIRNTLSNLVDRFGQEAVAAFIDEADNYSDKKSSNRSKK